MEIPRKIIYAGETFWLQTSGRYYQSGRHNAPERLLHRRIYTDHYGPIPAGYVVHHDNENWQDNTPSNLILKLDEVHGREHMLERMADPDYRARALEGLGKAQHAARAWHSTPEGLAWHSEHGKACWDGRESVAAVCTVCGTGFDTYFPSRARFCSRSCMQREGYQRAKTSHGICEICGVSFVVNKYRRQACCSRKCGSILRWHGGSGLQSDTGR